jgi:hypothetical protein
MFIPISKSFEVFYPLGSAVIANTSERPVLNFNNALIALLLLGSILYAVEIFLKISALLSFACGVSYFLLHLIHNLFF